MAPLTSLQGRDGVRLGGKPEMRVLLCGTGRTGVGQTVRLTRVARLLRRVGGSRIKVAVATGVPRAAKLFGSPDYETVQLHAPAGLTRWGRQTGGGRRWLRDALAIELLDVINAFEPHVFVTPHHAGIGGELPLVYSELRRRGVRIVLGLRDQYDSECFADHELLVDNLREYIDQVIVWAPRWAAQGIPDAVVCARHAPVSFAGFVGPPSTVCRADQGGDQVVTCQVGGGIDGLPVLRAAVAATKRARALGVHVSLDLVAGPFTPLCGVASLAEDLGDIGMISEWTFRDESPMCRPEPLRISMAGYNTCVEAVCDGIPAVLVPRSRRGDREQARRASLFAANFSAISTTAEGEVDEITETIVDRLITPIGTPTGMPRRGLFVETSSLCHEVLGAMNFARMF